MKTLQSPFHHFWWETNNMAENPADSLPAKRSSPSSENPSHSLPSKSPNPTPTPQSISLSDPSKNPKKAAREAKKAEKQAKKQEKLKNKEKEEDSSEEPSNPDQDLSSDPPSPKIKSQSMLEEEDDDYTPVDEDSAESDVSLLSEERDHGDIDNFDLEEYKKFLASQKDEDL